MNWLRETQCNVTHSGTIGQLWMAAKNSFVSLSDITLSLVKNEGLRVSTFNFLWNNAPSLPLNIVDLLGPSQAQQMYYI